MHDAGPCDHCNGTGKKERTPWPEINGGFLPGSNNLMTIAQAIMAEVAIKEAGYDGFPQRFDLDVLEKDGWKRNWGDAAVMSPYFEVLRREGSNPGSGIQSVEFLVLCPTFLRGHLRFFVTANGWGSY